METERRLVACGQLRSFPNTQELGSLVVHRNWRGQDLGKQLAQHLIQRASHSLYLECLGINLMHFYQNLGFQVIDPALVPSLLGKKFNRSSQLAQRFRLPLYIMAHNGSDNIAE